jgi:hypothetical protein
MYVQLKTEERSCNHCCSRQAISITYCEFVFVALGIQHAKRMSGFMASSVAFPPLQYLSTSPHKRQDFFFKKRPGS